MFYSSLTQRQQKNREQECCKKEIQGFCWSYYYPVNSIHCRKKLDEKEMDNFIRHERIVKAIGKLVWR